MITLHPEIKNVIRYVEYLIILIAIRVRITRATSYDAIYFA